MAIVSAIFAFFISLFLIYIYFLRNQVDIRVVVGQGVLNVQEEEEMVFEIDAVEIHPQFE